VPARLESTRFPRKVLATLMGRPLVAHVADRLARATLVDDVVVATDEAEVAEAVEALGFSVALIRERCETGSDRVAAAAATRDADVVVNLQADQPLIEPRDIDRVIARLDEDRDADLTTLAFRDADEAAYQSADVVKVVIDTREHALYYSRAPIPSRRQPVDERALFLHHVGIYCFRRPALERFASLSQTSLERIESLEQLRALENGLVTSVVLTDNRTVSVDRPDDLRDVEERLRGAP
jgi:3-deoxy-manno-octulosonate cytidylyltransferase (CMP-KDO synthetase)